MDADKTLDSYLREWFPLEDKEIDNILKDLDDYQRLEVFNFLEERTTRKIPNSVIFSCNSIVTIRQSLQDPKKRVAILFPGQGTLKVGMVEHIRNVRSAKAIFDMAEKILGYDLFKICQSGPQELLDRTDICQPAVFVTSLAFLEKVKQENYEYIEQCVVTAGYSLGEYAALVFSGILNFEDALQIVNKRALAMHKAAIITPTSMMFVTKATKRQVNSWINQAIKTSGGDLQIAIFMCKGSWVVAGSSPTCNTFQTLAKKENAIVTLLPVSGAFHTKAMTGALPELEAALKVTSISKPKIPILFNVDSKYHDDTLEISHCLLKQVVSPVQWKSILNRMLTEYLCDVVCLLGDKMKGTIFQHLKLSQLPQITIFPVIDTK